MGLFEAIKNELIKSLPGKSYQQKLYPINRPVRTYDSTYFIDASVSIIIYDYVKEPEIIFIKRPEYDGHHSGQISFPGGKKDECDTSLFDTAIRETSEEIGIDLQEEELIGELSPLLIDVSGFKVFPYVFYIRRKITLTPDQKEVDYIVKGKLRDLLRDRIIKQTKLNIRGTEIETPYYDMEGEIIWGATSMILSEFQEILRRVNKNNPGLL